MYFSDTTPDAAKSNRTTRNRIVEIATLVEYDHTPQDMSTPTETRPAGNESVAQSPAETAGGA
jgi:hypothetical protein